MKHYQVLLAILITGYGYLAHGDQLPLFGLNVNFNGTTYLLLPRGSENFIRKSLQTPQGTGAEILDRRNAHEALPTLLLALNKEVTSSWRCKSQITDVLNRPEFESMRPFIFFDDELNEAVVSCGN